MDILPSAPVGIGKVQPGASWSIFGDGRVSANLSPAAHDRRDYLVRFKDKTIRAWTYEMPDGKLEQFQVAVGN